MKDKIANIWRLCYIRTFAAEAMDGCYSSSSSFPSFSASFSSTFSITTSFSVFLTFFKIQKPHLYHRLCKINFVYFHIFFLSWPVLFPISFFIFGVYKQVVCASCGHGKGSENVHSPHALLSIPLRASVACSPPSAFNTAFQVVPVEYRSSPSQ